MLGACTGEGGRPADGGVMLGDRAFGEPCDSSHECASGICIAVGAAGNVCTRECAGNAECGGAPGWGCVAPNGYPHDVCACWSDTDEEICGDGIDNDCDGNADDCRLCDGVPTPVDDPENCVTCGNACRLDQFCDGEGCRCIGADEVECPGEGCVDLDTDVANCGSCGHACDFGRLCSAGACACPWPGPLDFCPAVGCVDLDGDEANCGTCGHACDDGQVCVGGDCGCPSSAPLLCGATCVDPETDESNCGACDASCPVAQECIDGDCACAAPGTSFCSDGCVDLTTDEQNCGVCGKRCPAAQECAGGECACPGSGLSLCGGMCVELASDERFCGACNVACAPGEQCVAGECGCPSGLTCGGVCVPVDDEANCGACDAACGPAQHCAGGDCVCNDPSLTKCGSVCADLETDEGRCGDCDTACRNTEWCVGGECRCPGDSTFCEALGSCVDLDSDEQSCGTCGEPCRQSEVCLDGVCGCPHAGEQFCEADGRCMDTLADEANCGECGYACHPDTVCQAGACVCPTYGHLFCASEDTCVNVSNTNEHCGTCDKVCPSGSTCQSYHCRCAVLGESACSTGCTDVRSDPNHCGACEAPCGAGLGCTESTCVCEAATYASVLSALSAYGVASGGAAGYALVRPASGNGSRIHTLYPDGTARSAVVDVGLRDATNNSVAQDVAYGANAYGVAFYQKYVSAEQLRFARFDADGVALGEDVILESDGTESAPYVEYHPTHGFVLAYRMSSQLYIRALGEDASAPAAAIPIDGTSFNAFAVSPGGVAAALVYSTATGTHSLVEVPLDESSAPTYTTLASALFDTGVGVTLAHVADDVWAAGGVRTVATSIYDREPVLRYGSSLQYVRVLGPVVDPPAGVPQVAVRDGVIYVAWIQGNVADPMRFQRFGIDPANATKIKPLDLPLSIEHPLAYTPSTPFAMGVGSEGALIVNAAVEVYPTQDVRAIPIMLPECP